MLKYSRRTAIQDKGHSSFPKIEMNTATLLWSAQWQWWRNNQVLCHHDTILESGEVQYAAAATLF